MNEFAKIEVEVEEGVELIEELDEVVTLIDFMDCVTFMFEIEPLLLWFLGCSHDVLSLCCGDGDGYQRRDQ